MFSRGDYTQGLCTAHEYYIQYVTNDVLDTVSAWLISSAEQSARGVCRDWSEVAHTLDTAIIRRAFEARGGRGQWRRFGVRSQVCVEHYSQEYRCSRGEGRSNVHLRPGRPEARLTPSEYNASKFESGDLTGGMIAALVERFQEEMGLAVDGMCGPITRAALLSPTDPPTDVLRNRIWRSSCSYRKHRQGRGGGQQLWRVRGDAPPEAFRWQQ